MPAVPDGPARSHERRTSLTGSYCAVTSRMVRDLRKPGTLSASVRMAPRESACMEKDLR